MATGTSDTLRRILIAEDDAIISLLIEDMIENLGGGRARVVRTCEDAVVALETGQCSGVFLDLHLDGGTSEAVAATASRMGVPVIMSTGSSKDALPAALRRFPILTKPWTHVEFERAYRTMFASDATLP